MRLGIRQLRAVIASTVGPLLALSIATWAATPPAFLLKWGSQGSGNGQFASMPGVAIDSSGNVYVADGDNSRIQKFDSNGNFLLKWGSNGSGDGQFTFPLDVGVDSAGNVYVPDERHHRIEKFDSNGNFLLKWGSGGSGDGQFNFPRGLGVDTAGNVYVADTSNHRIQKFDGNGNFLLKWGSSGSGNGQLRYPDAVEADSAGNVYVADTYNYRIQKFDSNGNFLLKWGSQGSGDGQFDLPVGIALDSSGNVYVVEANNHRIQKFDGNGNFVVKWGSQGSGDGQFNSPGDAAVDSSGNIYVTDSGNYRVQKFGQVAPPTQQAISFEGVLLREEPEMGQINSASYKSHIRVASMISSKYIVRVIRVLSGPAVPQGTELTVRPWKLEHNCDRDAPIDGEIEEGDVLAITGSRSADGDIVLEWCSSNSDKIGFPPWYWKVLRRNNWGFRNIGAQALNDAGYRGDGIKIAVYDSGFDESHPAKLSGAIHIERSADDSEGHGTQVTGVAWQIAPKASYYFFKGNTLSGFRDSVRQAIDLGIDVVNFSGGNDHGFVLGLNELISEAVQKGIIVIAAAGNDTDNPPYPCSINGVLCISSVGFETIREPQPTDSDVICASQSPRNSTNNPKKPDLAAPGCPGRIDGRIDLIPTLDLHGRDFAGSGSSIAAPHVAGTIALLLQAARALPPCNSRATLEDKKLCAANRVKTFLKATAKDIRGTDIDGWGSIKIDGALDCLQSTVTPPYCAINAPEITKLRVTSSKKIELKFRDLSTNELGFIIERSVQAGGVFEEISRIINSRQRQITSTSTRTFNDKNLNPNTTYCYRVRAFSQSPTPGKTYFGYSDWSAEQCATTKNSRRSVKFSSYQLTTAVINLSISDKKIKLTVSGQGIKSIELEIFDLAGRRVLGRKSQGNEVELDMARKEYSLANGVYLYRVAILAVDGEKAHRLGKFIKSR